MPCHAAASTSPPVQGRPDSAPQRGICRPFIIHFYAVSGQCGVSSICTSALPAGRRLCDFGLHQMYNLFYLFENKGYVKQLPEILLLLDEAGDACEPSHWLLKTVT